MSTGEKKGAHGDADAQGQNVSQGNSKIQRACDVCRRKKIRCDGGRVPRNRCSNCIAYRFECTYIEAAKKRGPPKGYVDGLENRLRKIEQLLSRICTEDDVVNRQYDMHSDSTEGWSAQAEYGNSVIGQPAINSAASSTSDSAVLDSRSPVDTAVAVTNDSDNKTMANEPPTTGHFFGNSSMAMLLQTAVDMKQKYTSNESVSPSAPSTYPFVGGKLEPSEINLQDLPPRGPQPFTFPVDDLMVSLVDLYFKNVNIFLPLLHRPTFEKSLAERQHLTDELFGETLLLVCSVGCLYSDDPRIFLDEFNSRHSAGWKWFMQMEIVKKQMVFPPTVYALQSCALTAIFLESSSAPQSCWTMTGIGLRLAQDVGAHRKRADPRPTVQDELWKRAFWVLLCLDRSSSVALGRPCGIHDEDFDLDLPIECDDEYWEHPDPAQAFKQPPGKPSYIAYFNSQLKLCEIAAFMQRTIYTNRTSKILLGFVGQHWEQHIVAELDSALNKWVDTVPEHLRWEPPRDNELFFDQSVVLYATYYTLQISIHRPFIPPPRKATPMLSFPSLAICTSAARACSHVVDVSKRKSRRPMPQLQVAAFSAGTILIMNIWGGKRSGINVDHKKETVDIQKCMQALEICENRWLCTGRTLDLLCELARMGNLSMPQPDPTFTNKRERDSEDPIAPQPTGASLSRPLITDGSRAIAGSRRVLSKEPENRRHSQTIPPSFSLSTMYGDELGRLPLLSPTTVSGHGQPGLNTQNNGWLSASRPPGSGDLPAYVVGPTTSGIGTSSVFSLDSIYQDRTPTALSRMFGSTSPPSASPYQYRDTSGLPTSVAASSHRGLNPVPGMVQNSSLTMWSQEPASLELDEWGSYLTSVSESTQGPPPVTDVLGGQGW